MMRLFRSRPALVLVVLALLIGIPTTLVLARAPAGEFVGIEAPVKRGDFRVTVTTSGELRAPKFAKVSLPPNTMQAQVYNLKIASLVPEGTIVKEGDVVAEIDRAAFATKVTEVGLNLQKAAAQHEQAMLDSTLNLGKAREEMKTMELTLEEKRIAKEQAVYEAPSVKRQAGIDYEKSERALAQAKVDYKTKVEQAQAKMREVGADRDRHQNLLTIIQDVMKGVTITAPSPGMVIYVREWNGKKKTVGSSLSAWDPVVATLPDLSVMESLTYVNEIDVRKLRVGQPVSVTLDADPTKVLTGTVKQVANVGEQRPNSDAKVFEVVVDLVKPDTTLRPGMTTGNEVETEALTDVLYMPLDALTVENGTPIVFKRVGGRTVKQEIVTGVMNDDEVVVLKGLEDGDMVLLTPPPDRESLELQRLPGSTSVPPANTSGDTGQRTTVPSTSDGDRKAAPPAPVRRN
ncbi:MAG TPA: HlyD family secretion protein [Gemmatimonadaceae bacterium]